MKSTDTVTFCIYNKKEKRPLTGSELWELTEKKDRWNFSVSYAPQNGQIALVLCDNNLEIKKIKDGY
jgi:hypothetical protein